MIESHAVNRQELVEALGELSEEERRGLFEHEQGWRHPGRKIQRVIAGLLFAIGTIWAFLLIVSLILIVGMIPNVIFIFGWLIYGGWFFVMMGKRMSVSLKFFWMASIVVHASYGMLFSNSELTSFNTRNWVDGLLQSGLAWWIPLAFSVIALGFEIWAVSQLKDHGMIRPDNASP